MLLLAQINTQYTLIIRWNIGIDERKKCDLVWCLKNKTEKKESRQKNNNNLIIKPKRQPNLLQSTTRLSYSKTTCQGRDSCMKWYCTITPYYVYCIIANFYAKSTHTWIYKMFHLFVMTGTYYCPILHSMFVQLQELSQIKRDATAHYFHKLLRSCYSSYDL